MATFDLKLQAEGGVRRYRNPAIMPTALDREVLQQNALWFVRLRWIVVAIFFSLEACSAFIPEVLSAMGLSPLRFWPAALALALLLANVIFVGINAGVPGLRRVSPLLNIWLQIVLDLLCLTVVVHFVGTTGPAAFLYVVHIALACVFFPERASFLVTLIAVFLYGTVLGLEQMGHLQAQSLFSALAVPLKANRAHALQGLVVMLLLLIVWYVISRLSKIIREGEENLIAADEELKRAQEEKDRFALQTTHQLKAPLDAIRSSICLIQHGYCGDVKADLNDLLTRIDRRGAEMSALVMDVLRLSRLKSVRENGRETEEIDLEKLVYGIVNELRSSAENRGIRMESEFDGNCLVQGVREEVKMMLSNLIVNAVTYSCDRGTVRIAGHFVDGQVRVIVKDEGIGIPENKLPQIFAEYYRTKEAIRHNRSSSGIGLAIVRHVAETHRIQIRVSSVLNKGTSFKLNFPVAHQLTQN